MVYSQYEKAKIGRTKGSYCLKILVETEKVDLSM